ncbi:CbiM family transporter [Treponema pedis]|uniref:CbiM family transporter n=1 Tax=Treponema pedis TaxID=409322 RepID=UPI00197F1DE3|nr:CbiM family transporter [Treponema pedis]QSI05434.1 cobalt transporter CbiM [Treponema pedis]
MHISDGGLSTTVCAVTYAATAVSIALAAKGTKEEDIPKISLMAGTFFAISLIMIPIPPSSVHPLMCGLIGIIAGFKAPLAFFPALLLQALLFQHGGITTLGANTLMLSISSYLSFFIFQKWKTKNVFLKGAVIGGLSVIFVVAVLSGLLLTGGKFAKETFIALFISHSVIMLVEAVLTGFAVRLILKAKPEWFK